MRLRRRASAWMPRGKVLVMTAILIPAIMAFMALSVDVSVIATSKAQLTTISDAAALAGSMKLADEYRVRGATDLSTEISAAQSQAKTVAQDNRVLNTVPVINDNTSNSATGDVVVGYFNPRNHSWTPPPLSPATLANAVQVTASRNSTHGGLVPGFFSRAWGYGGTAVKVQSIAMAQNYPIQGFQPAGSKAANSPNANLLPIVLDVNTWQDMMARKTTDQYTYNISDGSVSSGADGVTESQLYPVGSGSPGNWGTIQIGVSDNSTATLVSQILYGITPSQLATYPNSTIQAPITFQGNPGISAGIKSALDEIIGQPVVIPIYDGSGGEGANAWYHVSYFQPARIMATNFQGNPKYVTIQPCLISDPTAIPVTNPGNWPSNFNWQWGGLLRAHLVK